MAIRTSALALGCSVVLSAAAAALCAGCAPRREPVSTATLSSSDLQAYRETETATADLVSGRYADALAHADHAATAAPHNAWAAYDRAVALGQLGQVDAAVVAFRAAEGRFGANRRGRVISAYGRARTLDDAGRCDEAKAAYDEYAALVGPTDPDAAASVATYAGACRPPVHPIGDLAMSEVTTAIITHRYADALRLAENVGEAAKKSGWLDYNRAIALVGLGKVEEGIEAYRVAERLFGTDEPRGRVIAVYGRARALDGAGRCADAKRAYGEFADLVRATAPADAETAMAVARTCGKRP